MVKLLLVFFDKDGCMGVSVVWWRDVFAVSAVFDGDESRAEEASEVSDFGYVV